MVILQIYLLIGLPLTNFHYFLMEPLIPNLEPSSPKKRNPILQKALDDGRRDIALRTAARIHALRNPPINPPAFHRPVTPPGQPPSITYPDPSMYPPLPFVMEDRVQSNDSASSSIVLPPVYLVVLSPAIRNGQELRGIHFIPGSDPKWMSAVSLLKEGGMEFAFLHDLITARGLLNDPSALPICENSPLLAALRPRCTIDDDMLASLRLDHQPGSPD
jgi:hypothetical protein